jgi:hypothetical protein
MRREKQRARQLAHEAHAHALCALAPMQNTEKQDAEMLSHSSGDRNLRDDYRRGFACIMQAEAKPSTNAPAIQKK